MDSKYARSLAFLSVTLLALVLSLVLSRGNTALALFQSSPVDSPLEPTATPTLLVPTAQPTQQPAATRVATITPLPGATIGAPLTSQPASVLTSAVTSVPPTVPVAPTLAPPTSVPLPPSPVPTPTVQGFLPAPTIVNPNDLQSLPLAQAPVSSGSEEDGAPPTPVPPATANSTVRAAVLMLNYLWLLCGGILLGVGAVTIFFLWRRGRQA